MRSTSVPECWGAPQDDFEEDHVTPHALHRSPLKPGLPQHEVIEDPVIEGTTPVSQDAGRGNFEEPLQQMYGMTT